MEWQFQLVLAWVFTASNINLLFAGLCVLAAAGLSARWFAALSALLYLALAFV
jgi:hypothetical protein